MKKQKANKEFHHPLLIRVTHWVNFIALGIMVASGLRIFNASPLFDFRFPQWVVLGGWLGGARQWHFAAMWLFVLNAIVGTLYNIISKHGRHTTLFRPRDRHGLIPMIRYYLRIDKAHPVQGKYNALQKLAYTSVPLLSIGVTLSGLVMYMPVQFQNLGYLFGGYDGARWIHFIFMAMIVQFFLGHIFMVVISSWWNFLSMITGWMRISKKNSVSPETTIDITVSHNEPFEEN